jgi:hypothetical protein
MPHVLDRGKQLLFAVKLTVYYGKEIEDRGLGSQAQTDLVPELEKVVDLDALNEFNEKTRKWIDAHPQP